MRKIANAWNHTPSLNWGLSKHWASHGVPHDGYQPDPSWAGRKSRNVFLRLILVDPNWLLWHAVTTYTMLSPNVWTPLHCTWLYVNMSSTCRVSRCFQRLFMIRGSGYKTHQFSVSWVHMLDTWFDGVKIKWHIYIYIWEWDLWRRLRTLKRMATVKCLRNHHQESPISLHQSQPCQGISCLQLFLVEDLSAWQRLQTALTTVQKLTSPKNNAAEVFGTLLWRLLTSKQEKIQTATVKKWYIWYGHPTIIRDSLQWVNQPLWITIPFLAKETCFTFFGLCRIWGWSTNNPQNGPCKRENDD